METAILPDLLRKQAAAHADRAALVLDGVTKMTYGEWETRSNAVARQLTQQSIGPGDRVALCISNRKAHDYMVSYFAVHKAGGVVVPVNVRLAPTEMAHILTHSGAQGAIVEDRFVDSMFAARREAASLQWIASVGKSAAETLPYGEWLLAKGDTYQVERQSSDLADIMYTSGTTGFPKGVAATHENILGVGRGGKMERAFAGGVYLHAVPLFTFAGSHGMMLVPLRAAMTSVVQPKFSAGRFLELIAKYSVTLVYAVPSMLMLCLGHPDLKVHDYKSLKMVMYGTAPMPPEGVRKLADTFVGTYLLNVYGLTEGGGAVCSLPPKEAKKRPDSIGRPLPPTEMRITRDDGGECAPREVGEIWMRTPTRRRYFNDDGATSAAWTDDGWLRTGDAGYVDEDGYLYLSDRKKDMIIRGGYNVYPAEIEAVLYEHPAVIEAAVVGVPHDVLGEDVKAFVVLREGGGVSQQQITDFCLTKLADYKSPRQVEFLDSLPRNALDKVLKRELRERH